MRIRITSLFILLATFIASAGLMQLLGISSGVIKLGALASSIGLAFLVLCQRGFRLSIYPATSSLLFLLVILALYLLYRYGLNLPVFSSFLQVFGPIVFFLLVRYLADSQVNRELRERITNKYILFVVFILTAQVLAAGFKLAVVGQDEGRGIGTLSVQAGSLSTFIVVLISSAGFWCKRLSVGFAVLSAALFFAWVNEKRLGVLIAAFSFGVYGYLNLHRIKTLLARGAVLSIAIPLFVVLFYLALQSIDSILHGYSVWQLPVRIFDYLNQSDSSGRPIGRLAGLLYSFDRPSSMQDFLLGVQPLFSFGSSALGIASSYADVGFRPSAFVVTFVRFGVVGVFVWAILFVHVISRMTHQPKLYLLALFVTFDFLIYSDNAFVSYFYMLSIYFAMFLSNLEKHSVVSNN